MCGLQLTVLPGRGELVAGDLAGDGRQDLVLSSSTVDAVFVFLGSAL